MDEFKGLDDDEMDGGGGSSGGGKKGGKGMMLLVGVLLLSNGALAVMQFLGGGSSESETADAEEGDEDEDDGDNLHTELGHIVSLDPFVLNLDEPHASRYLRLTTALELDSESTSEAVQQRMPLLRDRFITHLANQQSANLATSADKDRLREELLRISQDVMSRRSIQGVYFTEFIIQ